MKCMKLKFKVLFRYKINYRKSAVILENKKDKNKEDMCTAMSTRLGVQIVWGTEKMMPREVQVWH